MRSATEKARLDDREHSASDAAHTKATCSRELRASRRRGVIGFSLEAGVLRPLFNSRRAEFTPQEEVDLDGAKERCGHFMLFNERFTVIKF
jgi:hypothetical protein